MGKKCKKCKKQSDGKIIYNTKNVDKQSNSRCYENENDCDCTHKKSSRCTRRCEAFSVKNPNCPRWGHDNKNTFSYPEKTINKHNVSSLVEVSNFDIGQLYDDSLLVQPIIVDGIGYIVSLYGYLYAYDVATSTPLFTPIYVGSSFNNFNSNYGSTPAILGDNIYLAVDGPSDPLNPDQNPTLQSRNRFTGVLNWERSLTLNSPFNLTSGWTGIDVSVSVVDDCNDSRIFITTDTLFTDLVETLTRNYMYAYDLKGNLIWKEFVSPEPFGLGVGSWSTPSFDTDLKLMYYGTTDAKTPPAGPYTDSLQARNYITGKLVWNHQIISKDVHSDILVTGNGNSSFGRNEDVGGSPNLFDVSYKGKKKRLVGVVTIKNGGYVTLDRETGRKVWETPLSNIPLGQGAPSASYANGVVYVCSTSQAAKAPHAFLQVPILPVENQQIYNIPSGGTIIIKESELTVYALNACTGDILWSKLFEPLECDDVTIDIFFGGVGYTVGDILTINDEGTGPAGLIFRVDAVGLSGDITSVTLLNPGKCLGNIGIVYAVTGGSGQQAYIRVNNNYPTTTITITNVTNAGGIVTYTGANTLRVGQVIDIVGVSSSPPNVFNLTSVVVDTRDPTYFTIVSPADGTYINEGSVTYNDLHKSQQYGSGSFGAPVFANGILYIGQWNGIIRALDASTGTEIQQWVTPPQAPRPQPSVQISPYSAIPSGIVIVDGVVYITYCDWLGRTGPGFPSGIIGFGLPNCCLKQQKERNKYAQVSPIQREGRNDVAQVSPTHREGLELRFSAATKRGSK